MRLEYSSLFALFDEFSRNWEKKWEETKESNFLPFTVIFKFVTLTNGWTLGEIRLCFSIFNVFLFILRIIRDDSAVWERFGIQMDESEGIFAVFQEKCVLRDSLNLFDEVFWWGMDAATFWRVPTHLGPLKHLKLAT